MESDLPFDDSLTVKNNVKISHPNIKKQKKSQNQPQHQQHQHQQPQPNIANLKTNQHSPTCRLSDYPSHKSFRTFLPLHPSSSPTHSLLTHPSSSPHSPPSLRQPKNKKHSKVVHMTLTTEEERKETHTILSRDEKLNSILTSSENLLHALKVIASIKPHERFSTVTGIYVQAADEQFITFKRTYCNFMWGENREKNLQVLKAIFIMAFIQLEELLEERETFGKREPHDRLEVVCRVKNTQHMERLKTAVENAKESIINLKTTYSGDTHTCARIDSLTESIEDRLVLTDTSVKFLEKEGIC